MHREQTDLPTASCARRQGEARLVEHPPSLWTQTKPCSEQLLGLAVSEACWPCPGQGGAVALGLPVACRLSGGGSRGLVPSPALGFERLLPMGRERPSELPHLHASPPPRQHAEKSPQGLSTIFTLGAFWKRLKSRRVFEQVLGPFAIGFQQKCDLISAHRPWEV